MARPPTCHPDRVHCAHGLCGSCYARERYPLIRVAKLERLRKARAEDPESFREYGRAWRARLA